MPYYSQLTNNIEPKLHHMRQVNLDALVNAYIDCALWSSSITDDESPHYGEDFLSFTLSDTFKQNMRDRIASTLSSLNRRRLYRAAIVQNDYNMDQFGHDLWLTENGHGTGYWDREQLEFSANANGDRLGDLLTDATQYREAYLYLDDNDRVCID